MTTLIYLQIPVPEPIRRKPAAAKRRLLASACYSKLMRRYFKPRL